MYPEFKSETSKEFHEFLTGSTTRGVKREILTAEEFAGRLLAGERDL